MYLVPYTLWLCEYLFLVLPPFPLAHSLSSLSLSLSLSLSILPLSLSEPYTVSLGLGGTESNQWKA